MTDLASGCEAILCEALQAEVRIYSQALRLAEALPAAFQKGELADEQLRQVLSRLDEVAVIESNIADAKTRWQTCARLPGPELQAVLDRLMEVIRPLTDRIQQAEKEAAALRDRLVPQIDVARRGQQMRRAYAGVMNQPGPSE